MHQGVCVGQDAVERLAVSAATQAPTASSVHLQIEQQQSSSLAGRRLAMSAPSRTSSLTMSDQHGKLGCRGHLARLP